MRKKSIGFTLSPWPFALSLACALLFALSFPAEAQQPGKIHRIGFLSAASAEAYKAHVDAFLQGLRELGYYEGKNSVVEQRYAAGQYEKLPELAAELVRLKVDVIVVHGGDVAGVANEAGKKTIPIVFAVAADPLGSGLIASLARPGGNITGLSDFHADLVPKRLELLKETVPSVSRVAVLVNPASSSRVQVKDLQAAAPGLGLTIVPLEVTRLADFDGAFAAMKKKRAGAVLAIGNPMISGHLRQIADLALKDKLPAIYTLRQFVDVGGLMSYGTNFDDLYRRAATYVDKILRGTKPADLPVEQPTKFELVINLKTAKRIGLTIPPSAGKSGPGYKIAWSVEQGAGSKEQHKNIISDCGLRISNFGLRGTRMILNCEFRISEFAKSRKNREAR